MRRIRWERNRSPALWYVLPVPSIVAMLVSALYNIVDQLFIGQAVGTLGNAATNVAFPLTTSCVALALMFGIGGASCFNLNMGRGNKEQAIYFVGNALVCLAGSGLLLCILTQIFMEPLLILFGRAGQCVALCKDVCEDYGGGISVSDSDHRRLSSDSCRRQPADGDDLQPDGAIINTILDAMFTMSSTGGWPEPPSRPSSVRLFLQLLWCVICCILRRCRCCRNTSVCRRCM